jgi:pimeloyl-ACP methyl ester carboxylesterase
LWLAGVVAGRHARVVKLFLAFLGLLLAGRGFGAETRTIAIAGTTVVLQVPDQAAPGRPWLWVGEFGGHLKSLEQGLVARGWHVVYVKASNRFGSPSAMAIWEQVYAELHERLGLAAKPALLGISRGGLYVNAWTRLHPDRVSVLYLDNGVCDVRSWPGGFSLTQRGAGSANDWKLCRAEFGYVDEADAQARAVRPAEGMQPAVAAGVLLISVHGTADQVVPYVDNAAKIVALWQQHGGRVQLFPKEGCDHHPHGLPDPAPLIELLVAAAR